MTAHPPEGALPEGDRPAAQGPGPQAAPAALGTAPGAPGTASGTVPAAPRPAPGTAPAAPRTAPGIAPVAVVGPSGVGKDFLMTAAAKALPGLHLVRRVITRPASAGGEAFEGVSEAEFAERIAAGAFALHWRAHDLAYGIPLAELTGPARPVMNLSRGVLAEAQARWPDLLVIHVTAPAPVLAARLAARGRESSAGQQRRLARSAAAFPPGLRLEEVVNDASPELGLARFLAALSR